LAYVLGYRSGNLDSERLQEAIAAFWEDYDRDEALRTEVNSAAEPIVSLDPETRRGLVKVEAPGGLYPEFIDVLLDPILVKVTAELLWRMIEAWIAERRGLDALGERHEERDREA